jgi:hypothetical protein
MAFRDGEIEALGVRLADEVKTLVIRRGDTLVLTTERRVTDQDFHEMMDYIRELVPGVRVLIIPEIGDIRVFRPEPEPEGIDDWIGKPDGGRM